MMNFSKIQEQYTDQGFALIQGFLSEKEADELKNEGKKLVDKMEILKKKAILSTTVHHQSKDDYYLQSHDKIRYFYEADALNENGDLIVDKSICLHKIGHGIHFENELFRKIVFDDRVKGVLRLLNFKEPGVLQSMINFKNPSIGSIVTPHQDATYLYSEPSRLIGFWIALEDATLENGCLWFLPGSHKNGIYKRYVRNPEENSDDLLMFEGDLPVLDRSKFIPVPAQKGDCVILHGKVFHLSDPNKSNKSRHAFTFHVTDEYGTKWFNNNWLQRPKEGFPNVYNN